MEVLKSYHWPGNVRELQNIIERICVMSTTQVIQKDELPQFIRDPGVNEAATAKKQPEPTASRMKPFQPG